MTEAPLSPPVAQGPPPTGPSGQTNGLAIAGMVCGIVGLVGICIWWLGLPCAIVGLILSIMGRKKARATGTGGGMAMAGIICSLIALGLVVLGIILARLLVPADFGIYAIALATLAILQSMNDLGTAVAVIRWQGDPARPARTATTISILGSIALYGITFVLAPVIAH